MGGAELTNNYIKVFVAAGRDSYIAGIYLLDDRDPDMVRAVYDSARIFMRRLRREGLPARIAAYRVPVELRGLPIGSVMPCASHDWRSGVNATGRLGLECRRCGQWKTR